MLHFAVPNIFFQLTLEYVTDSCTKLCSGLILQKHEFKVFFSLDGTFSKLSLLAQIGLLNSFVIFHYVIFCYIFRYFIFCYILSVNFFSKYCYNQKQSSGGVMRKVFFFKNSAKFTNIHLWWSPFFDEIADLQGLSFSKERLQNKCFLKKLQHFSEHLFDRPHRKTATNHWCCLLFHYNISFGCHVRLVENDFKHIFQPAIKSEINKNKNFVLLRELLIKIA